MFMNDGFCPRGVKPAREGHKLEGTKSIKETTAGLALPEEMDEHQPPGCSIGPGDKNCLDEAVMASKKDTLELQLIDDRLQVSPRHGQVVFRSVNPVPPDETPKTATDPDAMTRKPTIYGESH